MSFDDDVFCRGWDCGVRFYDDSRSIYDNPFPPDDMRWEFFRMGFNSAASADRNIEYINRITDEYFRYS